MIASFASSSCLSSHFVISLIYIVQLGLTLEGHFLSWIQNFEPN